MHCVDSALEDDGVGEFDGPGVAAGHYAGGGGGDVGAWTDKGAERDRCLSAYCGEVAEWHDGLPIDGGRMGDVQGGWGKVWGACEARPCRSQYLGVDGVDSAILEWIPWSCCSTRSLERMTILLANE